MQRLERPSFCKVNLLLNILGKRPDGFHELETVMQPVPLSDLLCFERKQTPGIDLTCSETQLPCDARNLVHRAAFALFEFAKIHEGVRIHLEKRIPLAAGLGGGSGNAATTLLAVNEIFGHPVSGPDLERLAATLGSDVPFFLQSGPALGTGRGEMISPLGSLASLRGVHILLIHPGFGVSTPWAYQALQAFPDAVNGRRGRAAELVHTLQHGTLAQAATQFYNALEAPVLRKHPILEMYQEFLRDRGACATLMSGSGSTTFALAASAGAAESLRAGFLDKFGGQLWTSVVALD